MAGGRPNRRRGMRSSSSTDTSQEVVGIKMQYLKSLWWVISLQRRTAPRAFVWNLVYNIYDGASSILSTYVAAKLLASVTQVAFGNGHPNQVYLWMAGLLVIEVLSSVLRSINWVITRRVQQKVEQAAIEQYFMKLYDLSQEQFEDEEFNTVAARAREGLTQLWRVSNELMWTLSSLIKFFTAMAAIMVVAWPIGLLVIAVTIPVAVFRIRQNKLTEAAYKKVEPIDRVAWRTRWYLLDPQYMPEVRLVNGFKQLLKVWRDNTQKSNDMYFEVERKNAKFEALSNVFGPGATFFANVYFFRLLLAGSIGLDRFIFLRGVLDQAANAAVSLASSADQLHQMGIEFGNFNAFYYKEPAIPNGKIKVTRPLTIEFKNVSFKYAGTDKLALDDVSFLVVPGSRLALVGENGAGKTTLIKLLFRQYLPTSGQILVNGHDIRDIEQESYYECLSILSQNYLVYNHLTIRENLTMGLNRDIKDKEFSKVIDMVGAEKFIGSLPHKLEQRLDSSFDDGSNLSGGQLQRLGVARALLRDGDMMILDEPTSAIDAKAEYEIFNNIYREHADRTTLIVSHRFSTVRKADKVIVMSDGKIIEYGSHEELMKYKGLYKEMFDLQAEGYR